MLFKERLAEMRIGLGLSKKEVAEKINVDQSTYGKYELGHRQPSLEILQNIADFFGVTTDYLLAGKKNDIANDTTNEKENEEMDKKIIRFSALEPHEKIIILRKEEGLSAKAFCVKLNIDESVYFQFELGTYDSAINMDSYNDFLSVTTENTLNIFKSMMNFYKNEYKIDSLVSRGDKYAETSEFHKSDLSYRIIERRNEKLNKEGGYGITQDALAEKIEVDILSVICWESGQRHVSKNAFQKLNGVLALGEDMIKKYETEFASEISLSKDKLTS